MNLTNVDLNLLVVLHALLTDPSVSRAARRLGLSQPALSHSLRRLRELLHDPILVRTGRGMMLTERAEALVPLVEEALRSVQAALTPPEDFSPATCTRRFSIMTTDMVSVALLPTLLETLAREAPGIDLHVQQELASAGEQRLLDGSVDLSVGKLDKVPASIRRQQLFVDRFVCVLRKDHAAAKKKTLSVEQWCELDHLLVAPGGRPGGIVDDALAKLGKHRHIKLTVSQFLVAPHVVAQSNLVWTSPERIAKRYAQLLPLSLREVPIRLSSFAMSQLWHEKHHHDRAHAWLRGKVRELAKGLESTEGPSRTSQGRAQ